MSKGVGEMVRSRSVQVKASAGTEGARRATGVPADGAAGEAGPLAPGQRWSVGRLSLQRCHLPVPPSPPRGLVGSIPPLRRYYETRRLLAGHPPALRCLRPAVPSEHLRFAPSDARCDVHGLGGGARR